MKPVDIQDFDAIAESEIGHEFELKRTDGVTGTGVYITILGRHADRVHKWVNSVVTQAMIEQQIAGRKGKPVEPKGLDELRQQNLEGAAIRVIGWRNVSNPFSPELLKQALARNPHWIDQIVAESDDLGNFTNAQRLN